MPPPAQVHLIAVALSGKRPMRCRLARGRQRRPEACFGLHCTCHLLCPPPAVQFDDEKALQVRCDRSDDALRVHRQIVLHCTTVLCMVPVHGQRRWNWVGCAFQACVPSLSSGVLIGQA